MSARKFLAALILVLCASCSFAEVTPRQVLSDPRFAPLVPATREKGSASLTGRYICAMEVPSRTGGPKILAPTSAVIEIMKYSPEIHAYPFRFDIHGAKKTDGYMTLDTEAEAPLMFSYTKTESGKYELTGKSYAALSEGDNSWLLGAVSDGTITMLIPIGDMYYPEGWYLGAWKCSDGTQFTFDGGKMYASGREIGTFTVEDNRITVTAPDGSKDTVYAIWNPFKGALVITFNSGPNGMGANAGVFTRMKEAPKPVATPKSPEQISKPKTESPKTESNPKTESSPSPKMPTEFPPMPEVNMPRQSPNIDGVWGAYVNGQQWIIQYQGNNYYAWINGQPSEMGIFTLSGNTMTGMNNHGVEFTAELELDDDGTELVMTFENGNAIRYMKLK